MNRRGAMQAVGKVLAGATVLGSFPRLAKGAASNSAPDRGTKPGATLRIATCQFPVSGNPVENAKYIRGFLRQAAEAGAHLLHTSEACLSGYAGIDFRSFADYDWATLREVTAGLRELAKDLKRRSTNLACWFMISPTACPRADGFTTNSRCANARMKS